jgi:hypothetical protein
MSVIKANQQIPEVKNTFAPSPLNMLLSELKSKLSETQTKYISGSSDVHEIPRNSGGIIQIYVDADYDYIPHVTLQCADPMNGINFTLLPKDDSKLLKVCIENLLDIKRDVRINYFLH